MEMCNKAQNIGRRIKFQEKNQLFANLKTICHVFVYVFHNFEHSLAQIKTTLEED
jgi:hypothetical protein